MLVENKVLCSKYKMILYEVTELDDTKICLCEPVGVISEQQ